MHISLFTLLALLSTTLATPVQHPLVQTQHVLAEQQGRRVRGGLYRIGDVCDLFCMREDWGCADDQVSLHFSL